MTDHPLCLALDVPTLEAACEWVGRTHHVFGTYKVGLQLFSTYGPSVMGALRRAGAARIFLDLKLHDIPNTVASAVRALAPLEPDWLTVHTAGGHAMMSAAVAAAPPATRILGVTVLTSLGQDGLVETGVSAELADVVTRRGRLAIDAGCAGVVCSSAETATLRASLGPAAQLVVPGIRLQGAAADDQRRVATPSAALAAGASLLVVGRAVTAAVDPADAMARLSAAVRP
jgi:orotidine-5'-phosphate decarboxylase